MWLTPWHPPGGLVDILVIIDDNVPTLGDHKATGDAIGPHQVGGDIGGTAWYGPVPSQQSHLAAGNGNEILHSTFVGYLHDIVGRIVHLDG